jgi:hypothetical protein
MITTTDATETINNVVMDPLNNEIEIHNNTVDKVWG